MQAALIKKEGQPLTWLCFFRVVLTLYHAIQRPDRRLSLYLPTGNFSNMRHCASTHLQKTELLLRIALFQPDIAGNLGTILRLSACFGVPCDVIEPCGFAFSDKALKRAGMDYAAQAELQRHKDWADFHETVKANGQRICLLTSSASIPFTEAEFAADDIILMGSESAGVPAFVHDAADLRIRIPMNAEFRSLNVAVAAGIALAEALRQTGQFP
jgi:tRNA (cytidine/uridine-2'-O-)-methyltransferase